MKPYGGRVMGSFPDVGVGFDLWEFGWHEGFTLSYLGDGYSREDVDRMWSLLWKTKPPDWQRLD